MPLNLSNDVYQQLMQMPKIFIGPRFQLPMDDETLTYTLQAVNSLETFSLRVERKTIFELRRSKFNTSFTREPIFRLEVEGRPHINPDGEKIGRNHVHVYKEGYGLSWTYPLETFSETLFKNPDEFNSLFADFCEYCNIEYSGNYQGVI